MAEEPAKENIFVDAGTPILEGRDGYYQAYLIHRTQIGKLIGEENGVADSRLYFLTRLVISGITDKAERDKLLDQLSENITERINEAGGPAIAAANKRVCQNEACLDILGEISTWYDKFVGITSKNLIDIV